jgi:predicted MFS family arabinose efflux permease
MFRRGNTPGKEDQIPLKSIPDDSELEITPEPSIYSVQEQSLFQLVRMHSSAVWMTALACLGALQIGFHIGYSSPAGKAIQKHAGLTPQELDFVLSMMNIGCIAGSLVSGFIANKFGRKIGLVVANLPFIVGAGIVLYAPLTYGKLLASRLCKEMD